MKTKFIHLLFFLFISVFCFAQVKTDLQKYNLQGKVKSVLDNTYPVVEKNGVIIEMGPVYKKTMLFNEKGFLIEIQEVGGAAYEEPTSENDVVKLDESFKFKVLYNYNDNGLLTDVKTYNIDGGLTTTTLFRYDSNRCLIEESGDYQKNLFLYNENGNLVEERSYNSEGTQLYEILKNTYNNNGILIEKTNYNNNAIIFKRNFEYGVNGKINKETQYNEEGKITSIKRYDMQGNEDQLMNTSAYKNTINDKTIMVYTYDDKSNWIKCISYFKYLTNKEKPKTVNNRVITYFK